VARLLGRLCLALSLLAPPALAGEAEEKQAHALYEAAAKDFEERRFELASRAGNTQRQAAIALETGRLHLERLGSPVAAEPWLTRSRELSPEDPRVFEALADLERKRGNDVELLANLEQSITWSRDEPPISMLLEAASLRSDRGEHDRALFHLERGLSLSPKDAIVVEALSDTLSTLGNYTALVDILERRAALATTDPETRAATLSELGAIHREQLEDEDAALDAFERAFKADPTAPDLATTLEQFYRKTDDIESLRSLYERAGADGPAGVRGSTPGRGAGPLPEAVRSVR